MQHVALAKCCFAEPGPISHARKRLYGPRLCSAPRREERRAALRPGHGNAGTRQATRRSPAMKVIFLDIDGVLNCSKTPNPRDFPYIVDKKLLARFKKLLERTGARVVLSSTWRCDPVGLFAAKHYGIPFFD